MERGVIPIHSIQSAYTIRDDVGYIRISNFNARTYKEFMDQIERLTQKEGMKDLIIDVRQNPGGYLKEAVNILSQLFKEKDQLLVYTEGQHAARTEYRTTGKPFYPVENLVVLVDEGSASASEILAGALQDQDRAIIVGTPTFGKGLVQEQYALSNGGALRLTIARYYTPSGRLIQKPYTNGRSVKNNGQSASDTVVYYTSKGRSVSGSGGITPDIDAEWDFNWHGKGMYTLYGNVLEYAIHAYHDDAVFDSVADLIEAFPPADAIVRNIETYFNQSPYNPSRFDSQNLREHATYAKMLLMAMIATDRFGHDTWFEVMNAEDPVVQKALEVIKEDRRITLKFD
jgi:carboxyl-terminal processing protease